MNNKKYTFVVANSSNNYNRTFSIHTLLIKVFLFFGIVVFTFSLLGLYFLLNKNSYVSENRKVKKIVQNYEFLFEDLNLQKFESTNKYIDIIRNNRNNTGNIPDFIPIEPGVVTQGLSDSHNGIDIAAKKNDPIKSAGSGIVVLSDYLSTLGNTMIISHNNGFYTIYGHNDTNYVNERELVVRGQIIGEIGSSGKTEDDSPHLHFEIWRDSVIVDPRSLIDYYKKNDVSKR